MINSILMRCMYALICMLHTLGRGYYNFSKSVCTGRFLS